MLSPKQKVHFIGIGGIGTSALSRWFLKQGWQVSGSDISSSSITQELKKQGVKVFIGCNAKNLSLKTNLVIYSGAVQSNNPEIKKAKKLGILIKSYAQALGDLTRKYKTLAITGTHGKTTTTGMLSLVLIKAGFDPTVIIGSKMKEFKENINFRYGKKNYLAIEADEHLGSFLNYSPFAVIITNIDKDHLDYYKNLINIKKSFLKMINNIQKDGILIVNKDDKNLFDLRDKINKIVKKNKINLFWYGAKINPRLSKRVSASLKVIGNHNLSNALGVYTLAKKLKIKEKDILKALSDYSGSWRRMEYKGNMQSDFLEKKLIVSIYDDYAHHPSEIKATLTAIAQKWPKKGLICVFQPHQTKRLSLLFKDFTSAFFEANHLILLDVFKVKGREMIKNNEINNSVVKCYSSKDLFKVIQKKILNSQYKLKTVDYLPYPEKLCNNLLQIIKNSNYNSWVVIMMGAGDIYKLTDKLISK
ncbi:UDP-N-acetylmuramate--L-alanine ligase [Candidatus Wolfebacteria bacterium]|nr:UDP-N-acetylmuramate--L-alanine ligase [Candidatus Wolfebacteria bacterium]